MTGNEVDRRLVELSDKMIATWHEVSSPPSVKLPDLTRASLSSAGAVAVIWGWTARVMRTAEAALMLHREGFDIETSPLLRSMLEHAVALTWVADKRGRAYQTLARERADSWARFKAAQTESWTLEGEAAALLESAISIETDEDTFSESHLLRTLHRAQAYNLGSLYQAWLVETWSTHATLLSAEPFFEVDPHTRMGTLYRVGREPDSLRVAGAIALAVHASLANYEQIHEMAFPGRLREWEVAFEEIMREARSS